MKQNIGQICRSSYIPVHNIAKIRCYLTKPATEKTVSCFCTIASRPSQFLFGLPQYLIDRAQKIYSKTADVASVSRKYDHIRPILKALHWLLLPLQIKYKMLLLKFNCIHLYSTPDYICLLITQLISSGLRIITCFM